MTLDSTLAGADACRGGWVIVQQSGRTDARISWRVYETLDELFAGPEVPNLVALDIPIGLPGSGARSCNREAPRLLGPKRGTSVFAAPRRSFLAADRDCVREVHPEICFYFMNGERPIELSKKSRAGRDKRLRLLRQPFASGVDDALGGGKLQGCSADDLLDASAALWTAQRIADGRSVRFPESPEHDEENLPMQIVA